MKQSTTFQLDNAQKVYSWETIFMLLSLRKVDPFLSEIHFPYHPKPKALTEISKSFFEQFYNVILWNADDMSLPAKELFETTNQKLISSIGVENTSVFCEWGNNLPIETPSANIMLQLWQDIILTNYHKGKLKNIFGEGLSEKDKLVQQSIETCYTELIQIDKKIDELEHSPADEWEEHVIYLYNRGEIGNEEVEIIINPYTQLWRLLRFLRIEPFLKSTKNVLSSQELDILSSVLEPYRNAQNIQINIKDIFESI